MTCATLPADENGLSPWRILADSGRIVNSYSRASVEESLLARIRRQPEEMSAWLMYADWLEEAGDSRAEDIRQQCQWRMPLGEWDVAWVRANQAARNSAGGGDVEVAIPRNGGPPLGIAEPHLVAGDLQHLNKDAIAQNFPRDDSGRLALNCCVLLAAYASELGPAGLAVRGRAAWLCAEATPGGGKQERITVRIAERIGEHHAHIWSKSRWYWDKRSTADQHARWGFPPARISKIAFANRSLSLSSLLRLHAAGKLTEYDRQALCVLLLDDARFADALALYGIRLSPSIVKVLTAYPRLSPAPTGSQIPFSWPPFLRRRLWRMAPWRMAQLLQREKTLVQATGSLQGVLPKRIASLPDQPYAAKVSLLLGFDEPLEIGQSSPGEGTGMRLYLESSNSNELLAEGEWARPLELDIARICLDPQRVSDGRRVP